MKLMVEKVKTYLFLDFPINNKKGLLLHLLYRVAEKGIQRNSQKLQKLEVP